MKNLCILYGVILLSLIIPSCAIDDTTPNTTLRLPFENLNEFFARQDISADTITIDASSDEIIITSNGGKLVINAGSFKKNNETVMGEVKVVTKELLKKSEMILLDKPSTSDNTILEYGGIIDFVAFKDYEPVNLQDVIEVTLPVNNQISSLGNMAHYKRNSNWMLVNNSPVDVNGVDMTLQFDTEDQGWMCGAQDPSLNDLTSVEVSLYGYGTILTDIVGFIVLSDYNTIIKMESDINGVKVSKSDVPKGVEASIVVIAMDHFKMVAGIEVMEIAENLSFEMKLDDITEKDLPNKLQMLD